MPFHSMMPKPTDIMTVTLITVSYTHLDFFAEEAEEVQAAAGGTVTAIRDDTLMGTVVVIESEETEWSYCGLSRPVAVEQGETVESGQVIGTVGTLPAESADEPHLHLEVRQNGELVDCERCV